MQRDYDTEPVYEFCPERGSGGAWITNTGAVYHIRDYASHCYLVKELLRTSVTTAAYALGWVRVSWNDLDPYSLAVTFEPKHVTVAALRRSRRVMRVVEADGAPLYGVDTHVDGTTLAKNYFAAYALISKLITEKSAWQKKNSSAAASVSSGTN